MRVPSPTTGTTNLPRQPEKYLQAAVPDLSGLTRGLSALAGGLADAEAKRKAEANQLARFKATEGFVEFNANANAKLNELKQSALPEDLNFAERAVNSYQNYEDEFIASLPEDIQDEFRMRTASTRVSVADDATNFQRKNLQLYQKDSMGRMQDKANQDIDTNPDSVEGWKTMLDEAIDNSAYSDIEKHYMKQENARLLESRAYKETVKREKLGNVQYSNELVSAAKQAADELGLPVEDWLTLISYETAGKFSTKIKGGAGGRYLGLIQFGPEEQKKYGVYPGQPIGEQMKAAVRFMKDRGFKPGMGILNAYSTINAGSPGRFNASDANNGGAPGTVADKVRDQMAGHRAKAIALLGGKAEIPDTIDEDSRFANVPYEDRMALRKDVDTEVNSIFAESARVRKAEHDAWLNDLLVRVQAGEVGWIEYDRMVDEGLLPDYDERKKVLAALEEWDKNGKVLRSAQERLARGAPFDPTDAEQKKELNALIGEEGIKKLQGRDAGYVSDELIPLFTKTGVLPGDVVGQLRGQAQSSNPLDMLYSFQALSLLENTNPVAYGAQVPDGLKHRADLWETLHGTVPDKELIDMLREAPTQALRDTKEYWMKEGEKLFSSPSEPVRFSDQFDDLGAPPSSPTMQVAEREWNTLFLENFTKTLGNKDAAIELTNKQFSRNWRKTGIDGAETLMKHPPELYTPTQYGTHEWLTNQVRGELALTDGERVVLVTDKRTEAEIAQAKAKGEKPDPSWLIMVQKENGLWDMARAPTGEALRHKFKPTPFDAKAHELDLRVESKKIELRGVMELMTTYGTSISGPPKEIADRAAKINGELEALKATRDAAAEDAKNFYQSPAAQEVIRLQKEYNEFQRQLYEDYLGPLEEWPKAAEFEKVIDDLEKAKAQAEIELQQKRTKVEGTP